MKNADEIRNTFNEILQWMDVRDDQGQSASTDLRRLGILFKAIKRKYVKIGPSPRVVKNEPNDLKSILAARPIGPRILWDEFDPKVYAEKVKGAWLARAAGCTLGAIVEGSAIEQMEAVAKYTDMDFPPTDYWTFTSQPWAKRYELSACRDYLRQHMTHVPVDDDLTYTLLGLLILEDFGPDFTTAQVGKAWLKYLPMACTAERVALDNLKKGVSADKAGVKDNPYVEWIGADIRSDPWGYAAPGWPEKAAELAYRDAYISHRYGGVYGEMFFSAAIAAAFAVDDPIQACEIGLTEIPRKSRVYQGVRWALDVADKVKDFRHARQLVDEKFKGMHPVHTVNNAALTIFGLALGGRDVTKVIGNTVAMGYDNDCTAATAGSIVGAVVGASAVPEHWYKPFHNKVRTYMIRREWFTNTDIVKRFGKVAQSVWDAAPECDCECECGCC
jgi:ADP-ribosylglycohydrolase